MNKPSSSLQRSPSSMPSMALKTLLCLIFLKLCSSTPNYYNFDLRTAALASKAGFTISGVSGDSLGVSVSSAGDFDNDGHSDLIVGVPGKNAAYVIYGGQKSSLQDLDFSSLTLDPHTTGFKITGSAGVNFGKIVGTAGDFNKDGYDDVMIATPDANSAKGAVYVIYGGQRSSMFNLDLSVAPLNPSTTGFTLSGLGAQNYFGCSISPGDINKDGYSDIVVGAYGWSSEKGAVYVIYGQEKSVMLDLDINIVTLYPTINGYFITGEAAGGRFGYSVSVIGDFDNDGYLDIVIGAPLMFSGSGMAYTIYGKSKASSAHLTLTSSTLSSANSIGWTGLGRSGDNFGEIVSAVGDINNDGHDDLAIISVQRGSLTGTATVMYGQSKTAMGNHNFGGTLSLGNGFLITGKSAGSKLGWSIAPIGDINRDGFTDLIVGAPGIGEAYVIYGKSMSTAAYVTLTTPLNPLTTGFVLTGNANENFGSSVNTAGDIDGDGYVDLIIGASAKNTDEGVAYVIHTGCGPCMNCDANCNSCSSYSVCTSCIYGAYFFYQSKCLDTCPVKKFGSGNTCLDCGTNCNHCNSSSICTNCTSPYLLYQSGCVTSCPVTTFNSTFICQDCPTHCDYCNSSSVCMNCTSPYLLYQSQCLQSCPAYTFASSNTCQNCSSNCITCTSEKSCKTCDEGYSLSNALCIITPSLSPSTQQTQQKASQAVSSAVTGAGSVLCVGSPTFPITALVSKIVQNTRYLNLTVTNELSEIYQTWGTTMISWQVPNTFSKFENFKESPPLFAQYGIGSSFMTNFWPTFMTIVIGLAVLCASFVVKILLEQGKYEGRLFFVVQKLVAGSFNFVIVQVYGCLDDILFNLVLDMKTNPFDTFFSWTSLFCAVGFLALGCSLVFMNMRVVNKYQAIKIEGLAKKDMSGVEVFNKRNKYWELFYSEFNDEDFLSQSALAFLIVRSSLSSLTITVFYDYPMMQTVFLVILDGAVIMFLVFKKPFNTLRGKLAQYYFETVTFLVHICCFVLALQDTFPTSSEILREVLCTGVIYLNTTLVAGSLFFMGIEIYEIIRLKHEKNKYQKPQEEGTNQLAIEENSVIQNSISTTQPIMTRVENAETDIQRSPNMRPIGRLGNLVAQNNNRSFSEMRILQPNRTLDLSITALDDPVLQDIETGSPQRVNQNRSPKNLRPKRRTTRRVRRQDQHQQEQEQQQQQIQMQNVSLLRNPARHLREKKPQILN